MIKLVGIERESGERGKSGDSLKCPSDRSFVHWWAHLCSGESRLQDASLCVCLFAGLLINGAVWQAVIMACRKRFLMMARSMLHCTPSHTATYRRRLIGHSADLHLIEMACTEPNRSLMASHQLDRALTPLARSALGTQSLTNPWHFIVGATQLLGRVVGLLRQVG